MNSTLPLDTPGARAAALAAAERSNLQAGLPSASPMARELDAQLVRGLVDFDEAIAVLNHHCRPTK